MNLDAKHPVDSKDPPTLDNPIIRTGSETDPASYIRDPQKLVAYLIPFPTPIHREGSTPPIRFLIYTPPPPPLLKPVEGEKDTMVRKAQRKYQEELREAKMGGHKTMSFKGLKGKVVKGHQWAFDKVTSADLEFVNRIPIQKGPTGTKRYSSDGTSTNKEKESSMDVDNSVGNNNDDATDDDDEDLPEPDEETKRAMRLEEIILVYPPSIGLTESQLREEFVDSLMRTRSKAQRDVAISTGLMPFSIATDLVLAHVGGPGGFSQFNGGWAALSIRGAHNARHVTRRLKDSQGGERDLDNLRLRFHASSRVDVLQNYLASKCIDRNEKLFPPPEGVSTEEVGVKEDNVIEAMGWQPSGQTTTEDEGRNEGDEAWERMMVEEDMGDVMGKAAKTWAEWCKSNVKSPKKRK